MSFHYVMKKDNIHTPEIKTDTGLHVMKEHPFIAASPRFVNSPRALGFNIGINITKLIFSGEFPNTICNNR